MQGNTGPKLATPYLDASETEAALVKSTVVNHTRLKFNNDLLYHAFMYTKTIDGGEKVKKLLNANALTKNIGLMFEMLEICVKPFDDLNDKGDISTLFEWYPSMIKLFAMGKKPNIVCAGFFLLAQLQHMLQHRPDLIKQIGSICTSLNEVFIEHDNSIIARALEGMLVAFDKIREVSVLVEKKRSDQADMLAYSQSDCEEGAETGHRAGSHCQLRGPTTGYALCGGRLAL